MILVDSHCHLNMLEGKENLDEVVERALKNHVKYIQTICTKLEEVPSIIKIVEKYDNIFASIGIHPNEVKEIISNEKIINLVKNHPKIIGIGETGLDYYYKKSERKKQISSLVEHIKVVQQMKLPIIIHTREAEEDTIDILTNEMKNANFSGLIHCFTASKSLARKMLDIGLYISIAGIITFNKTLDLQEVARFIPLDRLLIETDSPYLAPVPMRGKPNEPAFIQYIAEKISVIKGESLENIAHHTTKNFFTLFNSVKV